MFPGGCIGRHRNPVAYEDLTGRDLVCTESGVHAAAAEVVQVLFDREGKLREQGIGCDHETHVAYGSEPHDLLVKIPGSRLHHFVAAAGKTRVQDTKHRCPLGGEGRIAGRRVLGKKDLHRRYYCIRTQLPYPPKHFRITH